MTKARPLIDRGIIALVLGVGLALGLLYLLDGSSRLVVASSVVPAPETGATRLSAASGVITVCRGGGCPYDSIQAAVDAATEGAEIRVAGGRYTGVGNEVVEIEEAVTIRGGYTTTNWTLPNPDLYPTTLDGEDERRVIYVRGTISLTLEGLRITGGSAHESGQLIGGGIYVRDAALALRNSRIISNAAAYGGGIYLYRSAATLEANDILGNQVWPDVGPGTSAGGGGVYLRRSEATLIGNRVEGNEVLVSGFGGGLGIVDSSDALLISNTVAANLSEFDGGGLYVRESRPRLVGNAVTENTAWNHGGGLYLEESDALLDANMISGNVTLFGDAGGLFLESSDAVFTNTVLADNQAEERTGGLYVEDSQPILAHTTVARNSGSGGIGVYVASGHARLTNSVVASHGVGITVTAAGRATLDGVLWYDNTVANVGGEPITVTNALTASPAFAADGYHLTGASGAINQGVEAGVSFDIDGEPRVGGPDLGADEWYGVDLAPSRKTVRPERAPVDAVLTYTVVLSNAGGVSATNTVLFDPLPGEVSYVPESAWAASGLVTDADGIRWSGTVLPSQPVTITYQAVLDNGERTVKNTAIVTDAYGGTVEMTAFVNLKRVYLPMVVRDR